MALGLNAPHQLRVALGHPAQDKKGYLDSRVIEQLQQPVGIGLHPRGPLLPVLRAHRLRQGLNLIVVLYIHGHGVSDGA
jgi:hypothetical protein